MILETTDGGGKCLLVCAADLTLIRRLHDRQTKRTNYHRRIHISTCIHCVLRCTYRSTCVRRV